MLFAKYLLFVIAFGLFAAAVGAIIYDLYLAFELDRLLRLLRRPASDRKTKPITTDAASPSSGEASDATAETQPMRTLLPTVSRTERVPHPIRWGTAAQLTAMAAALALVGASIIVVPDGEAAVRISQLNGVRPGTLYAGTHLIVPLIDRVQLYDIRDRVFTTDAMEVSHPKHEVLTVDAKEGLTIGLAVTVRYRIDPHKLDYIQSNLPQPIDDEIVAPVVLSAFRETAPSYAVRDVFSTKREEFRERVAAQVTQRLGSDAIDVKEVLIRKIELPDEYSKGLEGLLMKEQEDDQTAIDVQIEKKRVDIAASQADAQKVRDIKHAEADAQSRVILAKAESDSMQYTLPLKQKQIEQSRLEAEARKQTTIEDADAAAQAKVIDSKAEQQRQELLAEAQAQNKITDGKAEQQREELLADAEADRIRVTAKANSEQLLMEADALRSNPLLVQYTVAQKLSDKVQIMLVPSDGKFFFTNDVLNGLTAEPSSSASLPSNRFINPGQLPGPLQRH